MVVGIFDVGILISQVCFCRLFYVLCHFRGVKLKECLGIRQISVSKISIQIFPSSFPFPAGAVIYQALDKSLLILGVFRWQFIIVELVMM